MTNMSNPEEIGNAYDKITHLWQNEDFDSQNGIVAHNKAIGFSDKKGRALDVGCGCNGRIIDLLENFGFSVVGVDVSGEMIRLARLRNPGVEFFQCDICSWSLPGKFDFITAWDSLWHLPLNQQVPVISKLVAALEPGGVFILSFGGLDHQEERKNSLMGPEMYYSTLGINAFLNLFLSLDCTIRHLEYDQLPEKHAYVILQKF